MAAKMATSAWRPQWVGQQRFRTGSGDIFQSPSGYTTNITCRDGARYEQGNPDTCGDYDARQLAGKTPFHHFVTCDSAECVIRYAGAREGERVIARCRP
jgi:hypothetical protein